MAKNPAFLFYVNDFDADIKFFTDEQVGKYIRLWISIFQHGHLSKSKILFITKIWDEDIMALFKVDNEGLYYSPALEEILDKRSEFVNKQKERANKRWQSRGSAKLDATASVRDMPIIENENRNENKNEDWNLTKKSFLSNEQLFFKICTSQSISKAEVEIYASEFIDEIETKEDYKNQKQLNSHFLNWIKFHKKKTNGKKSTKNVGAYELLDELRAEYKANSSGYGFSSDGVQS